MHNKKMFIVRYWKAQAISAVKILECLIFQSLCQLLLLCKPNYGTEWLSTAFIKVQVVSQDHQKIEVKKCNFYDHLLKHFFNFNQYIRQIGSSFRFKKYKKSWVVFFFCQINCFSVKFMGDRKSLFCIFVFEQKVVHSSNLVCNFTVTCSFRKLIEITSYCRKFY